MLDLVKESWEKGPSASKNEVEHILDLRVKLHTLRRLSGEDLLEAQEHQPRLYNRRTKLRKCAQGDKVLVLPTTSSSLPCVLQTVL